MKNSRTAGFLPFLIFSLAIAAAAMAAIAVRRLAAETFPADIAAGVLVAAGMSVLLAAIGRLQKRLSFLEKLLLPFLEKNSSPLAERFQKAASDKDAGSGALGERYAGLSESIAVLGNFLSALSDHWSRSRSIGDTLRNEAGEQDAILNHSGEMIDGIAGQFFTIEDLAKQAIEALSGIEGYTRTLAGSSGEKSSVLEEAVGRLSGAAARAADVAKRIRESAGKAESLRTDINSGEEQSRQVNDIVQDIGREVEKIAEMLAVINKIAQQTNILSLNAAIESAHAGQAGAGFAVVAEEIRKLAESTRENADRINEELSGIRLKTKEALTASGNSFETFNTASGGMAGLAESLENLSRDSAACSELSGEVSLSIADTVSQGMQPGGAADLMASYQSFKSSLEQILDLSGKTRTEIREIHSGAKEILEKTRNTQDMFLENLEETGNLEKTLPGFSVAPAAITEPAAGHGGGPAKSAAGAGPPPSVPAPDVRAAPQTAPAGGRGAHRGAGGESVRGSREKEAGSKKTGAELTPTQYSDSLEVTVKKPPLTIS